MNLGENIYRLRTQRNLSQGDLANALEVSRQSVSKWENNSAVPELEKLIRMAQLFGISLDELVGNSSPQPSVLPQENTPPRRLSIAQIIGMILLGCGFLSLILLTYLGTWVGFPGLGICLAVPFIICGVICLTCQHNLVYRCSLAVYLLAWSVVHIVLASSGMWGVIAEVLLIVCCIALLLSTLLRMRSDHLHLPVWCKILVTVILAFSLWISAAFCFPTQVDSSITTESTSVETQAAR